jgi:hypothetical protein
VRVSTTHRRGACGSIDPYRFSLRVRHRGDWFTRAQVYPFKLLWTATADWQLLALLTVIPSAILLVRGGCMGGTTLAAALVMVAVVAEEVKVCLCVCFAVVPQREPNASLR